MIHFNLNDKIDVQLTEQGRSHLRKWWDKLFVGTRIEDQFLDFYPEDEYGWTTFQLYDLVQIFGSTDQNSMYNFHVRFHLGVKPEIKMHEEYKEDPSLQELNLRPRGMPELLARAQHYEALQQLHGACLPSPTEKQVYDTLQERMGYDEVSLLPREQVVYRFMKRVIEEAAKVDETIPAPRAQKQPPREGSVGHMRRELAAGLGIEVKEDAPYFGRYPDPTSEELDNHEFQAIWGVIKSWDIGYSDTRMRSGAMGNHAAAILHALQESRDARVAAELNKQLAAALNKQREHLG